MRPRILVALYFAYCEYVAELTASDPLSIFLFENESRRERVRFTNTSSSLKVMKYICISLAVCWAN
jgi:hypothetical protein